MILRLRIKFERAQGLAELRFDKLLMTAKGPLRSYSSPILFGSHSLVSCFLALSRALQHCGDVIAVCDLLCKIEGVSELRTGSTPRKPSRAEDVVRFIDSWLEEPERVAVGVST